VFFIKNGKNEWYILGANPKNIYQQKIDTLSS
jgi:hypothetical protein